MTTPNRPVLLAILDGWGIGIDEPGNAVRGARTPVMDNLLANYPAATLRTSGHSVGLPDGQMGNSEVGHLNLGAGFVVYQWITRIDKAIEDGEFARNAAFQSAFHHVRDHNSVLHLVGMVGTGGVHSHSRHLLALLDAAKASSVPQLMVHAITDGRDTSPTSAQGFLEQIEDRLQQNGLGRIASVSGRYYAMDRDHRWERVEKAFDVIANAMGPTANSAQETIQTSYAVNVTDEFIEPTVVTDASGQTHQMGPDDAVIFFNFRSDRARQLTEALTKPDFAEFDRGTYQPVVPVTTMTTYEAGLPVEVAFPPHDVVCPVARVVSDAGLKQFHTAETEKYAHVTFFFNGGREAPFPGEDRRLVPSPKVATYDLQPEMSAPAVCAGVIDAIQSGDYDFIIVNFANADMVGHSGIYDAVVKAVETVDTCIGQIVPVLQEAGGVGLITADHGNAERLIDPQTGGPMTAHTTNPVPIVLVTTDDNPLRHATLKNGCVLSSVATTVIDLLGLPIPEVMTSESLIAPDVAS
jgi:2,3-bisphosphoglycerate-independent phosphoglycerate mutase